MILSIFWGDRLDITDMSRLPKNQLSEVFATIIAAILSPGVKLLQ